MKGWAASSCSTTAPGSCLEARMKMQWSKRRAARLRSWAPPCASLQSACVSCMLRSGFASSYTVCVDDIDTDAATELGIMVCHAPTESDCFGVAETTIAFMLSLLKKVAERDADGRHRGQL